MLTTGKGRKREGNYIDKIEERGRKRRKRRKLEILAEDWGETEDVSGEKEWLRSGNEIIREGTLKK